ncbi:MAG: hypothetical protein ACREPE_04335, partial [Lysobacter sp.]
MTNLHVKCGSNAYLSRSATHSFKPKLHSSGTNSASAGIEKVDNVTGNRALEICRAAVVHVVVPSTIDFQDAGTVRLAFFVGRKHAGICLE